MRRLLRSAAVVAGTICPLVAACGGGSTASGGTVVAASGRTAAAGSFRISVNVRVVDTRNPSHVEQKSDGGGIVDVVHNASHVTMTSVSNQPGDSNAGEPQHLETIKIGNDLWTLEPDGFATTAGRPWTHTRTQRAAAALGPLGSDPTTLLDRLKAKGATIHGRGTDTVRGVRTRHYAVTFPQGASTTTNPAFSSDFGVDVWIDQGQLVRRIQLTYHLKAQPQDSPPTPAQDAKVVEEFFDFGVPANIQPPPSDQVTEVPTTPPGGTITLPTTEVPTTQSASTGGRSTAMYGSGPCPASDGSSARMTKFSMPPRKCIDANASYTATLQTDIGTIVLALDPHTAPVTVNNFVVLARYHFYDGLTFHRAVPGFVIQGGDPTGTGQGGPGYTFGDELPSTSGYPVGTLAMANAGPNTNGSQFFIVTGDAASQLPPNYTIFGHVTQGQDVAQRIAADGSQDPNPPAVVHRMLKATITGP